MRIISWNTNGLRATAKQGFFTPLFKDYKPDILCLQETKVEPDQLPDDVRHIPKYTSYFAYSKARKGYSGVGIYSREVPMRVSELGNEKFDMEGRTLVADYGTFVLINCYWPNGGGGPERLKYKLEFYDFFLKYVDDLQKKGREIIFCGDINTAHTAMDLARPKENEENTGFLPIERAWLDKVVAHGYVDLFRSLYPDKKDAYTYWDMKTGARARNVGWRIDYFFATPGIATEVADVTFLTDYFGSDHCPLMLDFKKTAKNARI